MVGVLKRYLTLCNSTTGWSTPATNYPQSATANQGALSLNTTTKHEGSGAINLYKTGTANRYFTTRWDDYSRDFANLNLGFWLYIKDTTILDILTEFNIYYAATASGDYYKWTISTASLSEGWNLVEGLNAGNATINGAGTVFDFFLVVGLTDVFGNTLAEGDVIIDEIYTYVNFSDDILTISDSLTVTDPSQTYYLTGSDVLSLVDSIEITQSSYVPQTYSLTGSDTLNLIDTTTITNSGYIPQSYSKTGSDVLSLIDSTSIERIGEATGQSGKNSIYLNNSGTWTLFEHYETFRILKKSNQVSEFEIRIFDIQDAEKVYFKEGAEVLFFAGTKMILKGRIQTIEYGTEFEVVAKGYGMEAILLDKELIKSGDKRVEYDNVSAQTIANEILSVNCDGTTPWTMTPDTGGIFGTDWGTISIRYEYANKLNSLGALSNAINYDWWISQTNSDLYNLDYFHMAPVRGLTSSAKIFAITGTGSNAVRTSFEKDISNMANYVTFLGYGDGDNQLKTSTYAASTANGLLGSDITDTHSSCSITKLGTDFVEETGTARIMEEQVTYTGVIQTPTSAVLSGLTRGVNGTTARAHKKGAYIEQYYATSSPQESSSVSTYGLVENTQVDRTLTDLETAELVATGFLIDHVSPIERIKIIPDEPMTDAAGLDIGDLITVVDSESAINGSYRVVGIEYLDEYGNLSMTLEVSNVSLEFIEQMQQEKQRNQDLQKYMQGSSDTIHLDQSGNFSVNNPLYFKYYLPTTVAAVNEVNLKYTPSISTDYLEHSGTSISLVDQAFPSTPKVHILVGAEGGESAVSGSPFNVTNGSDINIDLTNEVNAAGVGTWIGIKLIPTGSDINRMRLDAQIFSRQFVKSQ